jgi:molybdenum cofactor biosynthesis enzyme MoaA
VEIFQKNRERSAPDFANINFLGYCNTNCFFCLGKDIEGDLKKAGSQLYTPPKDLPRLNEFLQICKDDGIKKIYITGQNCDSLQYMYLGPLFGKIINGYGMKVGVRTNGYNLENTIPCDFLNNWCELSVGVSIHTLNAATNKKIMGRFDMPNWDRYLPKLERPRVSIVLNRYNYSEMTDLIRYLSEEHKNIPYIQVRRISTDTRQEEFLQDVELYEKYHNWVAQNFPKIRNFHGAIEYDMFGTPVCFWRTVKTDINSYNYFSDGTISKEYFVVEGYLKNKGAA